MKTALEALLRQSLDALPDELVPRAARALDIAVERSRDAGHGDFASNLALRLASTTQARPRQLADALVRALPANDSVARVEVAGAGFINFFLRDEAYHAQLRRVLAEGEAYGRSTVGGGRRVRVEFLCASPAGPLQVSQGRQAAFGAVVASLLEAAGFAVQRECDVSDAGRRADLQEFGVVFDSGRALTTDASEAAALEVLRVLGAEHLGCPSRLQATRTAQDGAPACLEAQWVQSVALWRGARKVPVSTDANERYSLRDLRREVGNDAARLFFVMRSADQPLDFDLQLAQARSGDNPLYDIQYAHARVASAFKQLLERGGVHDREHGLRSLTRLTEPEERALLKRLTAFPALLEHCAQNRAPHLLANYVRDLAREFHRYHGTHPILVEDGALRDARLVLAAATQIVIRNGLKLLGVSAPLTV